jgi:hypothetical protein
MHRRNRRFFVFDRIRVLTITSIGQALLGALFMAYPLLHGFHGREFGNVTADGSVSRMPEYAAWQDRSDTYGRWGLTLIGFSTALQIATLFVPPAAKRA